MKFSPQNINCWRYMLTMGVTGHTPTKELGEMKCLWMQKSCFPLVSPIAATAWIWDSGIPFALKVVFLKGLERASHWSLTKTETGLCSVNLEILCSESFKTRWCKTRGTSPSLGVEAVALLKSFLSQWWELSVLLRPRVLLHTHAVPSWGHCLPRVPLPGTDACLVGRKPEQQHGQWETSSAFYLHFSCVVHVKACLQEGVCALGGIQGTVRGEDWRGLIFAHGFWHTPDFKHLTFSLLYR